MGNVNSKWLNVVFCIDESGSMFFSSDDVVGGFMSTIDEQRKIEDGKVTVSLFTFNNTVKEIYLMKDISEINTFSYNPRGTTSMNDGICTSIIKVGERLHEMDERGDEMPSSTMFVIMTDGEENSSVNYNLSDTKRMIKEQTDKYSWTFVFQGVDISDTNYADVMGIKAKTISKKSELYKNYSIINTSMTEYRAAVNRGESITDATLKLNQTLVSESDKNTEEYLTKPKINLH